MFNIDIVKNNNLKI